MWFFNKLTEHKLVVNNHDVAYEKDWVFKLIDISIWEHLAKQFKFAESLTANTNDNEVDQIRSIISKIFSTVKILQI